MNCIVAGLIGMTFLLVLAGGCSQPQTVRHTIRQTVILTPDLDGRVGKAEIITDEGRQILDKPHSMTTVSSRTSAPSPVTVASPEFIRALFAEVMAIEPTPPEKFILYFNNGTTELVPKSRAAIASILDAIKRRAAINISISGHTDSTGSTQINEKLARCRAKAISDLLVNKGVDAKRLSVSSHGKGNQLVPTADGVPEPCNRRVEVIVR
jgi:outer membrane protein OmpA-like peptidoglycan-associated protein